MRKIGIVALARKLSVALWRYLEYGEIPAGAELKPESGTASSPSHWQSRAQAEHVALS